MKEKNTAIEYLKIASIYAIVLCHFAGKGGFDILNIGDTVNKYYLTMLYLGGNLGVSCFVIVTGYFSYNNKYINIKKVVLISIKTLFFSIVLFMGFCLINDGRVEIDIPILLRTFLPIIFNAYWYITTYVVLLVFIPFLNKIGKDLTKRDFIILLGAGVATTFLLPMFTGNSSLFSTIGWFFLLYMTGFFLKQYNYRKCIFACTAILSFLAIFLSTVIGHGFKLFSPRFFMEQQSVLVYLLAVGLFGLFINKKTLNSNMLIKYLGSGTLGVYLLHVHPLYKNFIWTDLLNVTRLVESKWLIPYSVLVCFAIVVIGSGLDALYEKTIGSILAKKMPNCLVFIEK